ncbi:hypothetical protein KIN20_020847 [Parelaphostrongylus tenuis]|uniref:Uncharacterized protein n=1 Tax=Parelaphostrongylus tenuis TaxID=148309 RepID=A0AAD5N3M9_PARTN|nr:hypothetical protein KIN20_020847 [Parelaphostrongylus tenuis]
MSRVTVRTVILVGKNGKSFHLIYPAQTILKRLYSDRGRWERLTWWLLVQAIGERSGGSASFSNTTT